MSSAASRQAAILHALHAERRGAVGVADAGLGRGSERFSWAMRLVQALTSASALYSSGPVAPSIRIRSVRMVVPASSATSLRSR